VATAFGRVAASQLDQLLFDVPLDLDLVRPLRLRLGVEGLWQTRSDQTLADAADRADADTQGRDDLVVGVFPSHGGIRQQEDAGMGELTGRPLPDGNQVFQLGPFLSSQGDSVLVHRDTPLLRA
jgi:hypothetical protein